MRAQFGIVLTLTALCAPASAQMKNGSKEAVLEQCLSAFGQGQISERRAKLKQARERLAVCLDAECPRAVREECGQLFQDVTKRIPTIVLDCKNATTSLTSRGALKLDGQPLLYDGRALELDPGEHVFELVGTKPETFRATVLEGQRTQPIHFQCTDPAPPRPIVLPLALLSVSALGFAGFGFFGLSGMSKRSDLEACRGRCSDSDVDSAFHHFVAADISLGVGVLALGVASVIWFSSGGTDTKGAVRDYTRVTF
jgi:hypothetical protein